jgi:trimethylguanosine synthase
MLLEGWYSVTPELLATHIAKKCKAEILIDAFCGVGGNTIQFATTCERVLAIGTQRNFFVFIFVWLLMKLICLSLDIDPYRLSCAKHNASIYGVDHKIEFILGNYIDLIPRLKVCFFFILFYFIFSSLL